MAATSAAAVTGSAGSRNWHYVVIIACPETISEAGLITRVKACGITAAEVAVSPVIRSAYAGIIIIVIISAATAAPTGRTPVTASTIYITSIITTTHMIDLL